MKIIASSKTIANKLAKLDLNHNWVKKVELIDNNLHVSTPDKEIVIPVEIIETGAENSFVDVGARWDWIEDTLSKVDEQPVTLEIKSEFIVNVIFQY